MSKTLYLRVADDIADYVHDVADKSGLSLAKTAECMLWMVRDQGVARIEVTPVSAGPCQA